jgi:uncharacterized membrane protein (DUF106 family)
MILVSKSEERFNYMAKTDARKTMKESQQKEWEEFQRKKQEERARQDEINNAIRKIEMERSEHTRKVVAIIVIVIVGILLIRWLGSPASTSNDQQDNPVNSCYGRC